MTRLNLSFLGPPLIELDGMPVVFDTRKAIGLLAYLAVEGKPFSRPELAALFWPEYDPERAFHNLRRTLWAINKALGKTWLEVDTDAIRLRKESGFSSDVEAFRGYVQESSGHGHPAGKACPSCLAVLSAAADLYRGDFLAGFSLPDSSEFDDWQFFQAEGLKNEYAQVLEKLAHLYAEQGEYEAAIPIARRRLALDGLHEPAHLALMQLYAASGQPSAALRQFETFSQTLQKELGLEPAKETIAFYEQIRKGSRVAAPAGILDDPPEPHLTQPAAGPAHSPKSNLPSALTPFLGRQKELEEIGRLLQDPGCRLLTLLGPGGIGKTRLAIQAAFQESSQETQLFEDGVWFVPLASLDDAENLVPALAQVLRFTFYDKTKNLQTQLVDYLRQKRMLLVLDNFEHLVGDESAQLLVDLLTSAPKVKILATSRVSLNIKGEHLYSLVGLQIPEGSQVSQGMERLAAYSAVQLFVQSARRELPGFELDPGSLPFVVRICQLVQGMPLGIELAAAWVAVLPIKEIVEEISNNLDFLETDLRDVPERQRSLRAVFGAAWNMLNSGEREIFQKLSVFRGGFTRQAAYEVASASLRSLASLVGKALVYRTAEDRYEIHELLRQYAAEVLRKDIITWNQVNADHSSYYLDLADQLSKEMNGPGQRQAFKAVEAEIQNVRAAWEWAVEHSLFDLVDRGLLGMFNFLTNRGLFGELIDHLEAALAALERAQPDRANRLLMAKIIPAITYNYYGTISGKASELLQRSLDILHELDAEREMGIWYIVLASEYGWRIDPLEGIEMMRRCLTWLIEDGDETNISILWRALGYLLLKAGDSEQARAAVDEAISIDKRKGDLLRLADDYRLLADLFFQAHAYSEAKSVLQQRQGIYEELGEQTNAAWTITQFGRLALGLGEYVEAMEYFRAAREVFDQVGLPTAVASFDSWESIAALRYGNIDYARRLREKSLAISREINETTGITWNLYEFGELERIAGNYAAAEKYFQELLESFQDRKMTEIMAFYHKGMGDLAFALKDYPTARQHYEESLALSLRDYNFWCAAYATGGLGRVALVLGEYPAARKYIQEALEKALEVGDRTLILIPMADMAALFASLGAYEKAAGLASFIANHPGTMQETRDYAQAVMRTAFAELSPDVQSAIQTTVQKAELEAVAQLILLNPIEEDAKED